MEWKSKEEGTGSRVGRRGREERKRKRSCAPKKFSKVGAYLLHLMLLT